MDNFNAFAIQQAMAAFFAYNNVLSLHPVLTLLHKSVMITI
jgi:hypothetical protein